MAIPAYMWITDDQGKEIKGPVVIPGREGTVEVLDFQHEVRIPTDRDTGELTGGRKHEDMIFTKAVDSTTPYLYKAVTTGQMLQEIIIRWYEIDAKGKQKEYFSQTLSDVIVKSVKPIMHNVKEVDKELFPHLEIISLRYDTIKWIYVDGNISCTDCWHDVK